MRRILYTTFIPCSHGEITFLRSKKTSHRFHNQESELDSIPKISESNSPSVKSVHRQPRLWHVRALNWVSFSIFLAPEWANAYKSIKIPVLASNFVALTMINLYLIFTVEYMHPFDWPFFVLFKASSVLCLHTNCTAVIFPNAICV